jgi:hypothetical protein
MAFALGLAAVYMWNGLSIASNDVAVQLPVVTSGDNVIVVSPATEQEIFPFSYTSEKKAIIGGRDLSLYDIGEYSDECSWVSVPENHACLAKRQAARHFIFDHLANKSRGYIEIGFPCIDCGPVLHVFVEPDKNGRWGYLITLATNGPMHTSRGHTLKFRHPNSEEKESGYTHNVLSFIDDQGKEIESF